MKGCFIDAVGLRLPFEASDFLCQQDIDMIHNQGEQPKELRIVSEKITWNNWSSPQEPTHSADKESEAPQKILDEAQKKELDYEKQPDMFNGTAVLTSFRAKHMVYEWLNHTFNTDFVDYAWSIEHGKRTPPVTILCFNKTSAWHREGPVPTPNNVHPHFTTGSIWERYRHPAVCNFRLLGDINDSYLEFAAPSERLNQLDKKLVQKFFNKWALSSQQISSGTITAQGFPNFVIEEFIKIAPTTDYIIDQNYWKDHINVIAKHVGMHNPYIVNIGKWHKVTTNGEPRVTLRVHANPRTMTFEKIEELHNAGKLFK